MLIFLICFSLSKTFNKRISEGDQSTPSEGGNVVDKTEGGLLTELLGNLNYLLNDGINKTTFLKLFDPDSTESYLLGNYSHYINIASDKNYVPFPSYDEFVFSEYFDVKKTLLSIGDLKNKFAELKSTFKDILPIVEELGPDFAKVLNIDYNTIKKLYDYVLINNENDDVVFGKIFDILGLSKDWVPNVQKILSVYDSKQPISKVFEALNVEKEYNDFLSKISLLKVPSNDLDKFFSALKIEDAAISALQLASKAYINGRDMLTNNVMNPLLRTYFIKAINIFEYSIGNRAISLANLIDKIQGYSRYCNYEGTGLEEYKCLIYSAVNGALEGAFCEHDYEEYEEEPQCDALPQFKGFVIEFTYPQVNLTEILTDRFGISVDYINIAATLTDSTKNYVDVLNAVLKVLSVNQDLAFIYELPDFINFLNKIDQTTNFHRIYDFLKLPSDSWENATTFIKEISEKKQLCQNSFLKKFVTEDDTCMIEAYIKHYSDALTSEEKGFYESLQDMEGMVKNFIPLTKELPKPLSNLINAVYTLFAEQELASTPFIKRTGELLNVLIKTVDDVLPYIIKEVPVVKEFYPKGKEAFTNIFNEIKDDKDIKSLLNTVYDGIGVIIDFVSSAGNSLLNNEAIKFAAFSKSIKPTSFLNVYETASALSKVTEMTLHKIAESITYDGSKSASKLLERTLSINDLVPAKTLILNSAELAQSFEKKDLRISTISKALCVSENDLKQLIASLIEPAVSVPYNGIKNVLVHYSTKKESQITSDLNQLCSLLKSVVAGQNINTNVDGSYKPPTPSQSPQPMIDDTIKEDHTLGTVDISGKDEEEAKNAIQEEINKQSVAGKDNIIKIEGGNIPSGLDIKDKYLKVEEGATVNVDTEKMRLSLTEGSSSATIKAKNTNVDLSIKNDYESTLEIQPPEGAKNIVIKTSSEILAPITFVVPKNVNLEIETLNLHSNAKVSAQSKENEELTDIQVSVKNIVALKQTKAQLTKVTIKESLTIKTGANLEFTDVQFDDNSKLNLDLLTLIHSNYEEKPLISGELGKPPNEIIMNPPEDKGYTPSANEEYVLFSGDFKSGCKEWEDALKIDKVPEFDQKKCLEPTKSSAGLLETNSLAVFKKPDPKKKKLGPGPIAGIVVGCVAAVVIIVVVVVVVVKKKKNKNESTGEANDNDDE